MKRLYKAVKVFAKPFKSYQLRITDVIIEIKFTPHNDNTPETVYLTDNNHEGIADLLFSLTTNYGN